MGTIKLLIYNHDQFWRLTVNFSKILYIRNGIKGKTICTENIDAIRCIPTQHDNINEYPDRNGRNLELELFPPL